MRLNSIITLKMRYFADTIKHDYCLIWHLFVIVTGIGSDHIDDSIWTRRRTAPKYVDVLGKIKKSSINYGP